MAFDDLDNFLEGLKDQEPEEDEPMEYEVVEGFDFHNTDPLSDELLQYHTPQLNWLIREINNLKSYDNKDFDRLELKNKEIQDTILDVVRVAKTSEKEGNQWRAEYEAQVEENTRIGQDILRMTDKIEHVKGKSPIVYIMDHFLSFSANERASDRIANMLRFFENTSAIPIVKTIWGFSRYEVGSYNFLTHRRFLELLMITTTTRNLLLFQDYSATLTT